MKRTVLKIFIAAFVLVLANGMVFGEEKKVDPVGTWHFNAPDAPYEYSTGDIVITKKDGKYEAEIVYSEYYKLETKDFKVEGNIITFKAYVEGDVVYFKGKVEKDKITGKVSYSEGSLPITAERVKKKK
jgi:hypothetical protein